MKVTLSQEAYEQLHELIDYLEKNWSDRVVDNFLAKLTKSMDTMSIMPFGYPESVSYKGLRRCVVTPQTSIFYRVNNEEIEIMAIIDNRSDFF